MQSIVCVHERTHTFIHTKMYGRARVCLRTYARTPYHLNTLVPSNGFKCVSKCKKLISRRVSVITVWRIPITNTVYIKCNARHWWIVNDNGSWNFSSMLDIPYSYHFEFCEVNRVCSNYKIVEKIEKPSHHQTKSARKCIRNVSNIFGSIDNTEQ